MRFPYKRREILLDLLLGRIHPQPDQCLNRDHFLFNVHLLLGHFLQPYHLFASIPFFHYSLHVVASLFVWFLRQKHQTTCEAMTSLSSTKFRKLPIAPGRSVEEVSFLGYNNFVLNNG